ncbi:MAG: hypothetical protein O2816_10100, partial [Planctomycetota bacterium]|nr:hypothetical protein [Planctomycetota bacterium]
MTLHFLGWDSIPLDLAADWMAAELGADQSDVVVALPGARAGRLLRERLAVRLGPSWVPPRLVTAGTLTDVLLELNAVPAGRLARTLAWTKALQGLPEGDLERVVAAPPDSDDLLGWTRVAGE